MKLRFLVPAAVLAASCGATSSPEILDGGRCLEHVKRLVEIGPRPSGSPGIEKARSYISEQLTAAGHKPKTDRFAAQTKRGPVEMANVLCEIEGETKGVTALVTHYDTKRLDAGTFVGANDGGSGVGVLLEIARQFASGKPKPPVTLRLVFVDGEETQARLDWDDKDSLFGSRHEAERLKKEKDLDRTRVVILLDMVGDRNLNILRETQSSARLVDWITEAAREGSCADKFFQRSDPITDDHLPFIGAGVPDVIDLIDFDYGPSNRYWHTVDDTLDKISAESLRIVGDTVIRTLPKIAKNYP